ncbi:MAG: alpha-amylase family glycosyl hydrolase [Leptolyngbyaceae cyanobacterium MO_188.B28]|nr:alpha-amylase family glycosyl hydrolase [Leptolyngbyaceae cyanobacterium MO_188.B28]
MSRPRISYLPKPDFTKPPLKLPPEARERIFTRLCKLYGKDKTKVWSPELERILKVHWAHKPEESIVIERELSAADRFTEEDVVLITYGDLLLSEERSPLETLAHFLDSIPAFKAIINTLHILPFFPYSSDRGFSVRDFTTVDPKLGSWRDIAVLDEEYQLMFDGVFNHISADSKVFQEMLGGNPRYKDVFTVYHSPDELTPEQRAIIVRPRTSDVLTQYQSIDGPIWVWTTFSPDQIDFNFRNPSVLIDVIETLLLYVRHGADLIRLDAVTYLWEEPGTPCANLEQTHQVVKLFRDVLSLVAPNTALITETNVPHEENVSYFGDGSDEAQMVYNFALPPLVLYTFYKQDVTALTEWAKALEYPSKTTTFFNILDTHDGIGLMGVKHILSKEDINFIIQKARQYGAFVSYKTGEDGEEEPYEINTTWFSALNIDNGQEDLPVQVRRYVASRSIALVLRGVPGIYFHGLIGARNDVATVLRTKSKRDINRQVLMVNDLLEDGRNIKSRLAQVAYRFGGLLYIRRLHRAFHPNGEQFILTLSPHVFVVLRVSPEGDQHILTLANVTPKKHQINIPLSMLGVDAAHWYDLIGQRGWMAEERTLSVMLRSYGVIWLIPFVELEQIVER